MTYKIFANADQLKSAGLWHSEWKTHTLHNGTQIPNRVTQSFEDKTSAAEAYTYITSHGLTALKNWL